MAIQVQGRVLMACGAELHMVRCSVQWFLKARVICTLRWRLDQLKPLRLSSSGGNASESGPK